jgi:15-cis-phytoene synthase
MLDAYVYCERLVRDEDKDRFLATLFAPEAQRRALYALYAFELEIARAAQRVKEPLAGEIRLQWWRDAIGGAVPEQVAGNPVAAAFVEAAKAFRLPHEMILDLIDAHGLAEDDGRDRTGEEKAGALLLLATRILNDGIDPGIDELVRHAAAAATYDDPAHIRRHLDAAKALLAATPATVWPAFLPLALIRARLDRDERTKGDDGPLPQWRKQWILWRASKNLPRWL